MVDDQKIKTGTTCIGMKFKDGILLAADRMTSMGHMVAYDRSVKIHSIGNNIVVTQAGEVATLQRAVRHLKSELKLRSLKAERDPYVMEGAMFLSDLQYSVLRSSGGVIGFLIGGYDRKDGFSILELSPDGTVLPNDGYVLDGSGSVFIKSVLQNEYKQDMSEKEALALLEKCFKSSFKNDNASGGGYIAKIVTKDGVKEVERKVLRSELIKE